MRVKIANLSFTEKILVIQALAVREKAQSPYSNYCVGAAVLSVTNDVSTGCNVERANYTSTSHAEQVAIDKLVSNMGPIGIQTIAIAAAPKGQKPSAPVWPCGHCRGIIWENCRGNRDFRIITVVSDSEVEIKTIGELYPEAFGPEDLGIKI